MKHDSSFSMVSGASRQKPGAPSRFKEGLMSRADLGRKGFSGTSPQLSAAGGVATLISAERIVLKGERRQAPFPFLLQRPRPRFGCRAPLFWIKGIKANYTGRQGILIPPANKTKSSLDRGVSRSPRGYNPIIGRGLLL